jgi:RNA polymerase sigma-70 factor (ECF subfamily)
VGDEPSEAELVTLAQRGDRRALERLLRDHEPIAVRVAAAIAGATDAPDVVQEAFVRVHRNLGDVRPGAPLRPWLLTIVANQARNARRAAGRRDDLHLHLASARRASDGDDPAGVAEAHERRAVLLRAIENLPAGERAAIAYRYLLELSEAETAAVTGWPVGTVKSRTSRGLRRLEERLAPHVGPGGRGHGDG